MNAQDLFNGAAQIRDERKSGANTAERIGNYLTELATYVVDNRRALNGDRGFADAWSYPYISVYIEDTGDDWQRLNDQLGVIDAVVMNKYNGNCRFFVAGVRVDVQNRVLNNANKIVSQVAVGPLQLVGGKLAMANTADKTFRRIHNGSWSPWEEVAATGKTGSATGAEVFNSYSGDEANIASGIYSHAEGYKTKAQGVSSHAEGDSNTAFGNMSHAEGLNNFVSSRGGHVEGCDNRINSNDGATGRDSGHAHAEGYNNEIGPYAPQAHVQGSTNFAGAKNAHVEGYNNRLENGSRNAHIEGENNMTQPDAHVSHTEGGDNRNNGAAYAHIEGKSNVASTEATGGHVEGLNNTINNEAEHASGHWNLSTPGKTHYSVGIGASNDRKNAYEIDKQGNLYILGVNGYDGKNAEPAKSVQKLLENGAGSGASSEELAQLKTLVSTIDKNLLRKHDLPSFDSGKNYEMGDYIFHDGSILEALGQAPGEMDPGNWSSTSVAQMAYKIGEMNKNGYISDLDAMLRAVRNGGNSSTPLGQWVSIPVKRVGNVDNGYCDINLPFWAKTISGYMAVDMFGKTLSQFSVFPIGIQILTSSYYGMSVRFSAYMGEMMSSFTLDYIYDGEGWCSTSEKLNYVETWLSTGKSEQAFYLDEILTAYNKDQKTPQDVTHYVNIPFIENEYIGGIMPNPGYMYGGLFGSYTSGVEADSIIPVGFQPMRDVNMFNGSYELTWMANGTIFSIKLSLHVGDSISNITWTTVPNSYKEYRLSDIRPEGQPGFRVVDLTRFIRAQEDINIGGDGQFINPSKDLQSIVLQGYYKGDSLGARFESFPLSARCDDSAGHRLIIEFDTYGGHHKLVFETSADYDYIAKFLHSESQNTPISKA